MTDCFLRRHHRSGYSRTRFIDAGILPVADVALHIASRRYGKMYAGMRVPRLNVEARVAGRQAADNEEALPRKPSSRNMSCRGPLDDGDMQAPFRSLAIREAAGGNDEFRKNTRKRASTAGNRGLPDLSRPSDFGSRKADSARAYLWTQPRLPWAMT